MFQSLWFHGNAFMFLSFSTETEAVFESDKMLFLGVIKFCTVLFALSITDCIAFQIWINLIYLICSYSSVFIEITGFWISKIGIMLDHFLQLFLASDAMFYHERMIIAKVMILLNVKPYVRIFLHGEYNKLFQFIF